MEWKGMGWNGMQLSVMAYMEWNGMEWNGMEWNEIVCSKLMLDPPKSEPGLPKSVPEAPRDSKIRVREHFEQQVDLPWPIWAAIGTLEGSILALWGLIFGSPGIHCGARGRCWGHSWGFHLRFPARHMVTLSDLAAIFAENTKIIQNPMFSNGFSLILRVQRVSKSTKILKKMAPREL